MSEPHEQRPGDRRRDDRRHRRRRHRPGRDRGAGHPRVPAALPAARLGRSTPPSEIWQATLAATRSLPSLRRTARPTSWPASASPTSARRCCSGTARRSARPGARSSGRTVRTADICERLQGGRATRSGSTELTGLPAGPLLLRHQARSGSPRTSRTPGPWSRTAATPIGTVDSYLIARMTRGTWHVTDVSNASRTLLFDLEQRRLVRRSCAHLFGVPVDALPEIVRQLGPSWPGPPTRGASSTSSCRSPAIAGDQPSALFGQP